LTRTEDERSIANQMNLYCSQNTEQTSPQISNLQPPGQAFDSTGFVKENAFGATDKSIEAQGVAASVAIEQVCAVMRKFDID